MAMERLDAEGGNPENQGGVTYSIIEQAVRNFKERSHTPEVVTEYWQIVWKVWGEKVGLSLTVPACDRSIEEIKQLDAERRKLVYVPDHVASQKNRYILGKIFPQRPSFAVEENNHVANVSNQGGWFDIEASVRAPNTGTNQKGLEKRFKEQGKVGQRLNTYIIGSQDAKLQTNNYFDENVWSRLPGTRLGNSRFGSRMLAAHYLVDGRLCVVRNVPRSERVGAAYFGRRVGRMGGDLGGRSEGAKKA